MDEEDEYSLMKKVADLSAKTDSEHPKVSAEGYGTFVRTAETTIESLQNKARTLLQEAEAVDSSECVPLYLDSLFHQLRAQTHQSKSSTAGYLVALKPVIRTAERACAQARKYRCEKATEALDWALFNLKTFKLIKESELFSKHPDPSNYGYIIDILKTLNTYYEQCSGGIEIVTIESLEEGIKRRL